jgi:hypothetical protein
VIFFKELNLSNSVKENSGGKLKKSELKKTTESWLYLALEVGKKA